MRRKNYELTVLIMIITYLQITTFIIACSDKFMLTRRQDVKMNKNFNIYKLKIIQCYKLYLIHK